MPKILISFIVTILLVAFFVGQCKEKDDLECIELTDSSQCDENFEELEIPAPIKSKPEQILIRKGYTTSYNTETKNANWVAWHLIKDHTDGPWSRKGISYMVDDEVKGARQELEDWRNNEYRMSHGHLCPAGDNKWDLEAITQTFLLSNMCPQTEKLNGGGWKKLEEKCRSWASKYGKIYIVCGPIYYSDSPRTIGNGKIWVPDAFYKVVLCLQDTPKAIGFVYINDDSNQPMQNCVRTIDEIEEITGFDFFFNLPDEIEIKVEAECDLKSW